MIPNECKRLAEVDFPIANVSRSAMLENSQRGSHPKGLHLWWARRPLAACRSILLALLLPDPADKNCPIILRDKIRQILLNNPLRPKRWESDSKDPKGLRRIMIEFISDFSHPEFARKYENLRCARKLVAAMYEAERPVVYDSFAGGGSIPLEALRIGCDSIGSDYNPLACLILRTELELLPRYGGEIINKFIKAGNIIFNRFKLRIEEYYCGFETGETPIAYFWARQATCESPNCGVEFPLATSFWLCKKKGNEKAIKILDENEKDLKLTVFSPTTSAEVLQSTVANGKARCPKCGNVLNNDRLRAQLSKDRGGIEKSRLISIVTQGLSGRKKYLDATPENIKAAEKATSKVKNLQKKSTDLILQPFPNEHIPRSELRRISPPLYGCVSWEDLFLPRQRLALHFLIEEIRKYVLETNQDNLLPLLALSLGKVARHWNRSEERRVGKECRSRWSPYH